MTKFVRALRRAVATFIFGAIGTVGTLSVFDTDVATWKVILGSGIGAVINLVYRWSEAVVKEPEPVDLPGGDPGLPHPAVPRNPGG